VKSDGVRIDIDRAGIAKLAKAAEMRRTVETIAKDAATEAERRAPRDSGKLARSIGYTTQQDSGDWVGVVYFGQWYGKLWEWGHRGRSKPFLRPGVQAAISKYRGRFSAK
jgi:hypothetical protein